MAHLEFVTVDVFTSQQYSGNPLGVVFLPEDASTISQAQKQTIAREFNLSETIFMHSGTGPKRTIDIFTTDSELPFAGHPTIGAASWLLHHSTNPQDKAVTTLITKSGEIPITRAEKENAVSAKIAHNVRIHQSGFPIKELLRLIPSLAPTYMAVENPGDLPIVSIVNGMSQVHVELPCLSALEQVTTTVGGEMPSNKYLDKGWELGLVLFYFYVRDVSDKQSGKKVIRTRSIVGNLEDPATGSAASGLVSYLTLTSPQGSETYDYEIVQGVEMGRRSEIGLAVDRGAHGIERVELGGAAVKVSEGRIVVPDA